MSRKSEVLLDFLPHLRNLAATDSVLRRIVEAYASTEDDPASRFRADVQAIAPGPWVETWGGFYDGKGEKVCQVLFPGTERSRALIAYLLACDPSRPDPRDARIAELEAALKLWKEFHGHWNFCDVERGGETCDECESLEGFANDATDALLPDAFDDPAERTEPEAPEMVQMACPHCGAVEEWGRPERMPLHWSGEYYCLARGCKKTFTYAAGVVALSELKAEGAPR